MSFGLGLSLRCRARFAACFSASALRFGSQRARRVVAVDDDEAAGAVLGAARAVEPHREAQEDADPEQALLQRGGQLGEELPARNPGAEWTWIIDPIDGTLQFAAGLPNYGSLVALCHHGVPKLGVMIIVFWASMGFMTRTAHCQRRSYAADATIITR